MGRYYDVYIQMLIKWEKTIFINIWFAIRWLNKYILFDKGLFKGMQATQSVKWNKMYKWEDDMKYTGYEPKELCVQGTPYVANERVSAP